mgnify:FL=1
MDEHSVQGDHDDLSALALQFLDVHQVNQPAHIARCALFLFLPKTRTHETIQGPWTGFNRPLTSK